MELGDYVAILRRRWVWAILPTLLLTGAAWYFATSRPLVYETTARVLLDTTAAQDAVASRLNVNTDVASRDLVNEISLAESDPVVEIVRERLDLDADTELPEGSIDPDLNADVLNFTFSASTAEGASEIANTWAGAYVDFKRESAQKSIDLVVEQLRLELETLRGERAEIRSDLEQLEERLIRVDEPEERATLQLLIDRELSTISGELSLVDAQIESAVDSITQLRLSSELAGSAQLFQTAAIPQDPSNAPASRDMVIGALLGLIIGAGLAVAADNLDRTIRGADHIERLGLPVLGEIPHAPRKIARSGGLSTISQTRPGSIWADGFQKVRTAVQFIRLEDDIKTILITSANPGDGKSTTAVNLALAFANAETRVVLVDVDFRQPSLHDLFSTPLIPGFSDALQEGLPLDQLAVSLPSLAKTLRVLTAGTRPGNPAAFLASSALHVMIADLQAKSDLTLLDAPPTLPVADALSVAPHVDGVILVADIRSTKEAEFMEAATGIRRAGGRILGVVLNRGQVRDTGGAYTSDPPEAVRFNHRKAGADFFPLHPAASDGAPGSVEPGPSGSVFDQGLPPMAEVARTTTQFPVGGKDAGVDAADDSSVTADVNGDGASADVGAGDSSISSADAEGASEDLDAGADSSLAADVTADVPADVVGASADVDVRESAVVAVTYADMDDSSATLDGSDAMIVDMTSVTADLSSIPAADFNETIEPIPADSLSDKATKE